MESRNTIKSQIQSEVLDTVAPYDRCGVHVSMGVGKTLIGLRHMALHYTEYARFLVVATKRSILREWLAEAKKHGYEHLIPHITFTTYISLPKKDHDYDVVYLDECHNLLFSHDEWLKGFKGKILGLTGTPPVDERSEKGKMVTAYCPIVFKYDTDEAVEDKILNDYRIIVHTLPLNHAKNMLIEGKTKQWYDSELNVYDYWTRRFEEAPTKKASQIASVMRMKAMMTFPGKEILAAKLSREIEDKHIIFANTQEQADRLCSFSYHSNNPDSEENLRMFKDGEINRLSAVLQLNEGVNIPHLRSGIILHAYGNERKTAQRIGRLLRLNPKETATVHILCFRDTVDEKWVTSALQNFDQSKITWKNS